MPIFLMLLRCARLWFTRKNREIPTAQFCASFAFLPLVCIAASDARAQAKPTETSPPSAQASAPPSSLARRLYDGNKEKLIQIRVLVAGSQSQSSAGSAFFVTPDGLAITNYHVISQLIWEPERYRAEYVLTNQTRGSLDVVAIDVQHDLAVVRITNKSPTEPRATLSFAPDDSLQQGDRVFSMGNPLDLGFAISEGTFNGKPERSLYPQLLFTGAMNPGVSGGPAIDESGRVVGVNVAGYGRSAELTNFQVPVRFAREILTRAQARPTATLAQLRADLRAQLAVHQNVMMDAMHSGQWTSEPLGPYRIPVLPNTLARCWGEASDAAKKNYRFETSRCDLSSGLYLQGNLRTGSVSLQHEVSSTKTLSSLRFAQLRSKSMENERQLYAPQNRHRTASRCTEDFINNGALSFRAVVCLRGYRKLEGLFDISTLVVSMDAEREGLESVFNLSGVELRRGLRESKKFVESITRQEIEKPVPIFKKPVPGTKP